jgi:uncharacterized protein (DUF983 family)
MKELDKIVDVWLTHACQKGLHEQTKIAIITKIETVYKTVTKECLYCGHEMTFNRIRDGEMIFSCSHCSFGEAYDFLR